MSNDSFQALLWLTLTVLVFVGVRWLYNRRPGIWLIPILLTPLVLLLLLGLAHVPYSVYRSGADWLTFLLKPATVAFAVPIYRHWALLKKNAAQILVSVGAGSMFGITSSMGFGYLLGLSREAVDSLAARSVTTPIAMEISQLIGANATLTAVFVIVTGLLGFAIGPAVIRLLSLKSPVSKGVLMGMSAHGVGTSKAFEMGSVEGTVASLSMVIAAIATFFLAPYLVPLLHTLM